MATTQDYINQLKIDKENLVSMLNNMGVEAANNETFTSLTPKVGKIVTDPILQDKAITITENGTQTIAADEGYDGLNNVSVTTNVIGSSGGASLNIFAQETEPETKKGLWLQSNVSYEKMITLSSDKLAGDVTTIVGDLPEGRYYPAVGMIGDDIYIYGGATTGYVQTNNLYKFNIKDNTITTLRNGQASIAPRMAIIGTDIYIVVTETSSGSGSNLITKYNTLTNGFVEYMAEIPQVLRNPAVAVVGTDIYIIGGRTGTNKLVNIMYKYDTLTNSYTTITMPFYYQGRMGIAVGTDIYIFGSYTSSATSSSVVTSYKYDTLTGEFTQIADFPLSSSLYTPPVANGTDIYIINSVGNMSYVYDTLTNTYTEKSDISSTVNGWGFGAVFKDNYLYYVGGNASSTVLTTISKKPLVQGGVNFEDDTLIIVQDETNTMETELIADVENLTTPFEDVQYYNTNDGLIDSIPTYYGDGTEWIKFKN